MKADLSARDKVREGLSAALDKKAAAVLVLPGSSDSAVETRKRAIVAT